MAQPGDYLLRVWYLETVTGSNEYILVAELPIHIAEEGAGSQLLWAEQSPCGGWISSIPEEDPQPPSWSTVKALYSLY